MKGVLDLAQDGKKSETPDASQGTPFSRAAVIWRPIETAPKGGPNVLIAGRYSNGRAYVEESYWDPRGNWSGRKFEPPTHWAPMPVHPTENPSQDRK